MLKLFGILFLYWCTEGTEGIQGTGIATTSGKVEGKEKVMGYNENFSKAVYRRDVPGSMLGFYMEQLVGKSEAEKQKLLEKFAKEIEATFPYKKGMEPMD